MSDVDTAANRGRIAELKRILAFADEANAGTDSAPDLIGGGTDGHEA